ncbi:formate--tetrahydrofolate ligase [Paucilactobacillus nenjiangensis]|uniref:Formate--tetrahydrofolate ligase n=2 Tax=Paucilactobacillus nenjiangensis TaxID=1296540 RepID=A0A5P1X0I6_9LACO|nr:formate--tetrahydrofolate ligase [Paucilactobacillus nenjiangensis]QER67400.1 formate--tetrahydrofolate ligase [Paucilactobacillus nenjiangensis]
MTDLEIAKAATLTPIVDIADKAGLKEDQIEMYGKYKAKVNVTGLKNQSIEGHKLVLVTSINPTPAGEGKSTVLVGLGDAMNQLDKQTMIAMREPSMGPVMGIKGGATGGGYSQVIPMEDINLHFTGDMHALTSAHNTLMALVNNYLQHDNALNLDPRRIIWNRVEDVNDRTLRNVITGLGGVTQGIPQESSFDITAASELMAILCLASDLTDLKARIGKIVVGYTHDKVPVSVAELGFEDAITILLKDAFKPNLVQTLAHTPTLIHGGPFANIAHGCNSVIATKTALQLADYTVTEAGFGADLGAEKFLDIKRPVLGKTPDVVVIVATVRALKYNGGQSVKELTTENIDALNAGLPNLQRHMQNIQSFGLPTVVAINRFTSDTDAELNLIKEYCAAQGVTAVITESWGKGGDGTLDLAKEVVQLTTKPANFTSSYEADDTIEAKLNKIVTNIYHGRSVSLTKKAQNQLKTFAKNGWDKLPVCVAKTQYSFSDDAKRLGAPTDFDVEIREFVPKIGAGFIVALAGNVMTMPGLPKQPAALKMKIDAQGEITGLF